MSDKLTGKAQYLTVNAVAFKTTKITPKVTRKLADTTDGTDYDSSTDMLYASQLPVSLATEIAVEGFYYKSQTPSSLIAKFFDAGGPYAVTFGPATGYPHFGGNYDLSDFQAEVPVDDAVKVSFTLKSNGKHYPTS